MVTLLWLFSRPSYRLCVPVLRLVVNFEKTFVEGDFVLDLQVKHLAVPAFFFLCQPLYC